MPRIPFQELVDTLTEASVQLGLAPDRAARTARIFAESSRDGVQSHGLNRFPRFAAMVRNGGIDIQATAECVASAGAIERWDGHHGIGPLNASDAMSRAIALAREHGIGAVALAHTNHWMRGGTYGWQAADAGLLAICWTNTGRNLPAWGTTAPTLGNNPLILAVPRANPDGSHPGAPHVVLDMAMSQFSYGQLAALRQRVANSFPSRAATTSTAISPTTPPPSRRAPARPPHRLLERFRSRPPPRPLRRRPPAARPPTRSPPTRSRRPACPSSFWPSIPPVSHHRAVLTRSQAP